MVLPVLSVCTLGRSNPGAHMGNSPSIECHDPVEEEDRDEGARVLARSGMGWGRVWRIAVEGEGLESLYRTG